MLKNNDIKTFIFRNRKSYNVSLSHNYQEVYVCSTIDISKIFKGDGYGAEPQFKQYFNYIVEVNFIGNMYHIMLYRVHLRRIRTRNVSGDRH
jgi:hypothetical protein